MGILRTIFAITVVFAHSYGFVFVGGRNAVQLFYITSGFLISYILNNNKNYDKSINFFINRILRLYPVYYVVAVLTLFAFMFGNNEAFFSVYKNIPIDAKALLVTANLFLFGQDWVMFSGIDKGNLVFATNFAHSDIVLYKGLLVPQAWTLGVELSFYVIAPFVLRDKRKICALLIASLMLRVVLLINGIGLKDPWTYRFFPLELALFLMGALSQQWLTPFWEKFRQNRLIRIENAATFFLITLSIIYFLIPLKENYKALILFSLFIALLPLTFMFQDNHPIDKAIGDLSYPIYIGHLLVISTIGHYAKPFVNPGNFFLVMIQVIGSILFAFLLDRFVAKKVEKYRSIIKSGSFVMFKTVPEKKDSVLTAKSALN